MFHRRRIFQFVICLGIIAAYYPTFRGEFILDDKPYVKNNLVVKGDHPLISHFLQEDGIPEDQEGRSHSGYYRPLASIMYSIDYRIWGQNSAGFRTSNLFLHLLTCAVLYLVMSRILKAQSGPLLAVLLFGLHPVNTESVAWVSSRNNILVAFFSMASFYFYVRKTEESGFLHGWLSLLCFALALLSKEFAVMLLPTLVAYDRVCRRPLGKAIWGYLAFLSIFAGYVALRKSAIQGLIPLHYSIGQMREAFCFAPYLLMENVRLILFPLGLHNFMITYPEGCFGREALLGFAGTVTILCLLGKWRKNGIVFFSIVSFLMALFPVLNLIPTSAYSLVSMRWLYFPTCFLSLAAAWILSRMEKHGRSFLRYGILTAVAVYLGGYTFVLNEFFWKKEEAFFQREVLVFHNYFYAGDFARSLHLRGEFKEAERYYGIAEKSRSPDRASLLINHAALLLESGKAEASLKYLDEAEQLDIAAGNRGILWNNRGAAFFRMGDHDDALRCFQKAVLFAPGAPSYRANLGLAYSRVVRSENRNEIHPRSKECTPAGQ